MIYAVAAWFLISGLVGIFVIAMVIIGVVRGVAAAIVAEADKYRPVA